VEVQKIAVKVAQSKKNSWIHFCYVPYDIKDKFDKLINTPRRNPNYWIKKWLEDLGVVISEVITPEDLSRIKAVIRDEYKDKYPELFIENETDKQGWLRVWYTSNLQKELDEIAES
jgi:hypothetical protein